MKNTLIGWCHHTVNFWWGCEELSPACVNCYARELDAMRGPLFDQSRVHWGPDSTRWIKFDSAVRELRSLDRAARKAGVHRRVFINSMSDFFEERPELEQPRHEALGVFSTCTNLDILLVTKRAEYARRFFDAALSGPSSIVAANALQRIWMGFTGENQFWFDRRWQHIREIPAPVVFCSYEPACGPLTLPRDFLARGPRAWLIVGGESGKDRRPMPQEWPEDVAADCICAGVPLYVKQDSHAKPGQQGNLPDFLWVFKEYPTVHCHCTFAQRAVGDGCWDCNPARAADLAGSGAI